MMSFKALTDCLYYPNCSNPTCEYRHIDRGFRREIYCIDCINWLNFECFDKNCQYLHRKAVAAEESGVVLCKYNIVGCKRDDCPYLHIRAKSESPRDSQKSESPRSSSHIVVPSPRTLPQKSESSVNSSQSRVTKDTDDKKRKASDILSKYAYKQQKNENEDGKKEAPTDGALSSPRTFGGEASRKKKETPTIERDFSETSEKASSETKNE